MATTTNYSWTTPDDTALVKDGAAAIRSLGTAIDTTVFNNAGAAIAKTIVDAKGDIIAATAADTLSRLAVGANNTVLTADSSTATGLKWAAPGSSGKVLQVVSATYSTAATSSSDTFADTGLTASITPSSASSKVLVFVSHTGIGKSASDVAALAVKLLRGATDLIRFEDIGAYTGASVQNYIGGVSANYLDTPNTTSSTTYKTQFCNRGNAGTITIGASYGGGLNATSTITLMEIGA